MVHIVFALGASTFQRGGAESGILLTLLFCRFCRFWMLVKPTTMISNVEGSLTHTYAIRNFLIVLAENP
jgi:hypothetical protein